MNRLGMLSIRIQVPIIMLAIATLVTSLFIVLNLLSLKAHIRDDAEQEIRTLATGLQGKIDEYLPSRRYEDIKSILSYAALIPNINSLLVVDEQNQVVLSNQYGWHGQSAAMVSNYNASVGGKVRNSHLGRIVEQPNQGLLAGYYLVSLPLKNDQLHLSRTGLLYLEYDLDARRRLMQHLMWQDVMQFWLLTLLLAGAAAFTIDFCILRRIKKISRATQEYANGSPSYHLDFTGNDEVAELGKAFNAMTSQLSEEHQQLLMVQRRLYSAQHQAQIGDYYMDIESGAVQCSPELYRLLGVDPGLPAPPFSEHARFYTAESWPDVQNAAEQLIKHGQPVEYDVQYVRIDGQVRFAHLLGEVFRRDSEGKVVAIAGTFQDITERKRQELALKDSERRYRDLFAALQEGIWVMDKNANTVFVNANMANMLGYVENEMIGLHMLHFMDQRDVIICNHYLERRKQGIKETHEFELVKKNGERVVVMMASSPLTDEDDKYNGAISGVLDITDRKLAEEELCALYEKIEMEQQAMKSSKE